MQYALTARMAFLQGLLNRLDVAGPALLKFYEDPDVSAPEEAPAQAPLSVMTLADPCGVVSYTGGGLAVLSLTPATTFVSISGQIAWAQLCDGDGVPLAVMSAGLASDVPLPTAVLSARQVYTGGELQLLSAVWVL
jgi:hypothetical protein